jgi:hypothetical protein
MILGLFAPHEREAQSEVDLALVLAVDISNSMDPEEQELQRQGFVEAFRSPLVHKAISDGMVGRIAVVYLEWAGSPIQYVTVPGWRSEARRTLSALPTGWPRLPSDEVLVRPFQGRSTPV